MSMMVMMRVMIFTDLEEEEQCIFELDVYVCVFFRRQRDKEKERERDREEEQRLVIADVKREKRMNMFGSERIN